MLARTVIFQCQRMNWGTLERVFSYFGYNKARITRFTHCIASAAEAVRFTAFPAKLKHRY